MTMTASLPGKGKKFAGNRAAAFTETDAWRSVGAGWRKLHGSFREAGYSIEWHDFTLSEPLDWARTFHPGSLEICLNLSGEATVQVNDQKLELSSFTGGFYVQNDSALSASRREGERHQFITIELSLPFLERHLAAAEGGLHPRVHQFLAKRGRTGGMVSGPRRLNNDQQQLVATFQRPPVFQAAQRLWYEAKALEVVAAFLYQPAGEELFCQRQQHMNRDRVQKVLSVLKENLAQPPGLEELGRRVGCSHFYLSRLFTQEVGKTISVTLRDMRMERAATLLREGRMNVTEAALEVGYSSLSHFSSAFHEVIGCCPGLYPLPPGGKKL